MNTAMLGRWSFMLCLLVAAGSWACAGSSSYMREVPANTPIPARPDQATVVFVRPSGMGFLINFAILDQQGNWLGEAVAASHFSLAFPPGEYMFIGWAENTAALVATLAPGRVYVVEVNPVMGIGASRVSLEGLSPRHADWPKVRQWMAETKRMVPVAKGHDYYRSRRADVMKRVASANENWRDYSEEEKAKRSLRAEDGVPTGQPAPTAPLAQPIPAPPGAQPVPTPPVAQPVPTPPVAQPGTGCVNDRQCPGQAVCNNGVCVAPAAPPATRACGSDRDCPGDQVCEAGACVEPRGAPGSSMAPTPAEHANERVFERDMACEVRLISTSAVCGPTPLSQLGLLERRNAKSAWAWCATRGTPWPSTVNSIMSIELHAKEAQS